MPREQTEIKTQQPPSLSIHEDDTTTNHDGGDYIQEQKKPAEEERIASKENNRVLASRLMVLTVLVLSALGASLAVYFYLSAAEHQEFVGQFDSDATKVMESLGSGLDQTLGSADAFVVKIVAHARTSNLTWPFVELPFFGLHATKLLRNTDAFHVGTSHIILPEDRAEWEDYAWTHNGWIEESLDLQEKDPNYHGPAHRNYTVSYSIYGLRGPVEQVNPEYGSFLPSWQQAPLIPGAGFAAYNWNGWEIPYVARARQHAFSTRRAVLSEYGNVVSNLADPVQKYQFDRHNAWVKNYIHPDDDPAEPTTIIVYPIIDDLDSVLLHDGETNVTELPVVASLAFALRWISLLRNILPEKSKGIVVVFKQADCGEAFSYKLDGGPEAVYLGIGDLHDKAYDDYERSSHLADLMGITKASSGGERKASTSSYTGLPLDDEYCPKSISIYPSASMEEIYKTSNPSLLAVGAALIFLFTSAVFIAYDYFVARRQRIVMQRALASGRIVSDLFPSQVKQQLYEEQRQEQEREAKQSKFLASSTVRIAATLAPISTSTRNTDLDSSSIQREQIAQTYEATTVMMADFVGFTSWSSKRDPKQVFFLLEAVYGEFDSMADKRGVFKIETIGDCYVAVCGLPEPQQDHALRMTKFARSCLNEMNRLTHSLAAQLGEETESLQLRIGLNSGPSTAGVLRGNKARFQLFGDTINTASRMESNGEPGRIHVSESTAQELVALGRSHWLTPREDKVVAKGKGEMSTFWVSVRGTSATSFATTLKSTSAMSTTTSEDDILTASIGNGLPTVNGLKSDGDDDEEFEELKKKLVQRFEV